MPSARAEVCQDRGATEKFCIFLYLLVRECADFGNATKKGMRAARAHEQTNE